MDKQGYCPKHKYVYVNHRGFGNEFSIYTVPAKWTVRTWFDPNYRPIEQSLISRDLAIKRWNHYKRYDVANIAFYACPVCGYAPVVDAENPLDNCPQSDLDKFKASFA